MISPRSATVIPARVRAFLIVFAVLIVVQFPTAVQAQVITDFVYDFDGSEPTASFPGNCAGAVTGYRVAGPLQVGVSADYEYRDASIKFDIDMYLNIYHTDFDPLDTAANLVDGFDDIGTVTLNAGTDYFLVVEELCGSGASRPGVYAFSMLGPSELTGNGANPELTFRGTFDGGEPVSTTFACGMDLYYDVLGPVMVDASGDYLFHDVSVVLGVDITVAIYNGDFDPANPQAGRLFSLDDDGLVGLIADRPYAIVVQPLCENDLGVWDFMLIRPDSLMIFADGFEL